jgi:chorismate--pyruvate lyase
MSRCRKPFQRAFREASWTSLKSRRLPGASPQAHAWLSDRGSLTRSVKASCGGRFAVDVVHQAHGAALPSERALLHAGTAKALLVREVRLNCNGRCWVFARTLIPLQGLRGIALGLTTLGRRPLGEVLFSDPTTRRLRVQVARILPRHHLFAKATHHLPNLPKGLWGRRTLFRYGDCPILVNELFMPDIPWLVR